MPKEYSTMAHMMTNRSIKCSHCGNQAAMAIICEGDHRDVVEAENGDTDDWYKRWELLLCTNCMEETLFKHTDSSVNEILIGQDHKGEEIWERRKDTQILYPLNQTPDSLLKYTHWKQVRLDWQKALNRAQADPEGAITSSRTTFESVCKHILGEKGILDDNKGDVGKLYRLVSEKLNLVSDNQTNGASKKILGGCASIVSGMAEMRNSLGDAHGKKKIDIHPEDKHVRLAIGSAMILSEFLVESLNEDQKDSRQNNEI